MRNGPLKHIKREFEIFLATLSLLTRLPINVNFGEDWEERFKKSPRFFTLVGYLPGALYASTRWTAGNVGSKWGFVITVAGLSLGFYFFDLFHFDGLLDMFDGFLNQSSKERRLEIMSKGNVGPFAVFYGTLFILVFFELFRTVGPTVLIFSSVFGRLTMNWVLVLSKPAKQTGLGAMLFPTDKLGPLISGMFTLPLMFLNRSLFVYLFAISICVGVLVSIVSRMKIGGVTGDVLGGSCLIGQLCVLLVGYLVS
ncbi:adenosylcobinamide-GDP ribazoletransferase [Fervidobacterium thailandense]|uniref:Adenosylcobinamide-GDP ribazoletransferase n=1 Tax=Fervidobacterium thailandense TaxID=1008305 RepID=A0A1E3G2N5_9BACT|nr:adenosylcobinamide-GDP ribazoletransferase [Fervidobacterium thailandense]ODN30525.1 adenosylcobinamide-GDP ribazoletransferase [Fervidobacterium thailandense]